ncbi:MAG TPA: ABC transporter substrate-binding protein [Stellaceae bacterium]|jgi:peptide/nickel transport system substrate-binding protein|nr:ABC transporter substrate-binding protein [Stellaceae bacterium]
MRRIAFGLAALLLLFGAARASAQDTHRFVIATGAEPDSIDITAGFFPPINYVILRNIDEALWDYNEDGTIRQTVATWDYSPDRKTLVFHLKHGVKFHSGDELTAEDVVFGFQRLMAKTRPFARHGKHVGKIAAVDRYTVRLDFNEPDVNFFDGTSLFPASKAYYDRVGEKEFASHPNGIGPYAFVAYKPAQYFDLKAFPGYYGKQPHFKNVRFEIVKDAEVRVAKLRAGEADMIMDTPFPQVAALARDGFTIVKLPANPTVSIEFDMLNQKAPWHDRRVRLAIAHAIDGDAIVKGLFHGVPERHPRLAPGEFGFDPSLKNYSYDPALAKKLLAEAGYPNGFSLPLYSAGGNFYGFPETTEAVILYLKAVGIDAHLMTIEGSNGFEFIRKVQNDPSIEVVSISGMPVANSGLPSLDALTLSYYSKSPYVLYKYPEIDNGIPAALAEFDDSKRAAMIEKMEKFLYDDVASISLWDGMSVFAMKKNVQYQPIEHRMPFVTLENVTESK